MQLTEPICPIISTYQLTRAYRSSIQFMSSDPKDISIYVCNYGNICCTVPMKEMVLAVTRRVDCISITTDRHQGIKYKANLSIAKQTQERGYHPYWQSWSHAQQPLSLYQSGRTNTDKASIQVFLQQHTQTPITSRAFTFLQQHTHGKLQ